MTELSSRVVSPERVRGETALAPLLLQTEELLVNLLTHLLGKPVTVHVLKQERERHGFIRKSLLHAEEFPLYYAVTVVRRLRETKALIRTMRRQPTMPLGEALQKHRLFGRKSSLEVRRSPYIPEYSALFGTTRDIPTVWERTYEILSPRDKRVAGVTEIFSPRLEAVLREQQAVLQA